MTRESPSRFSEKTLLIGSVLIAGLCSIVYELLISTTASYFLGDSVKQFSITIGVYMAAMGLGSFISRMFEKELLVKFVIVEILLGLIGGLSVPLLYAAFAYTSLFYPAVLASIIAIGTLTGLEVPLLTRVLERDDELKFNLSNVLSMDYLGALLATLAFPFLLVPFVGVFRSALLAGLINMSIGFVVLWALAGAVNIERRRVLRLASVGVAVLLGVTLLVSGPLLNSWSESIYEDRVVYREQTPYQNIVVTRYRNDLRLYLEGNLQFSAIDEYRYHEPLIHIPAGLVPGELNVLMLGGGDGLGARELLKHPRLNSLTIVDLDPAIFRLAKENPNLRELNRRSLFDPRVETRSEDAYVFLQEQQRRYNLIIADLPDPKNVSLARLYSREFYRLVARHLSADGVFVTQATSPFFARKAFWSINDTLKAAGFAHVLPYHSYVPSFGDWGFVMAANRALRPEDVEVDVPTRYLHSAAIEKLFVFEKDLSRQSAAVSTIDRPRTLEFYLEGWEYWN